MAKRVPREVLHQRVWFTPAVVESLSEKEAADVADYLAEHFSTTTLWDANHPLRRNTRFRALFARRFANPS